jgi:transposase
MAYKRLKQNAFKWPAIKDGVLRLDAAQSEVLCASLNWRPVTTLEALLSRRGSVGEHHLK